MRKGFLVCLVGIFSVLIPLPLLYSQDLSLSEEEILLLKSALKVDLRVVLTQPGEAVSMYEQNIVKYTLPGRSVLLKVEGVNLKFYGYFTPYVKHENLSLLAHGEVRLMDQAGKSVLVRTFFKIIALKFREKVIFLPLGKEDDLDGENVNSLRIVIQIFPNTAIEEVPTEEDGE